MQKLLSKEAIKTVLLKEFDNDPRITDELLFDGKRLTVKGYVLLKSLFPRKGYHEGSPVDDISYHCYKKVKIIGTDTKDYDTKIHQILDPVINELHERLDKLVEDNGCYFISDCICGERDAQDDYGNRYHKWGSDEDWQYIDIWVFSQSGNVMEFADDNESKCQLLLETVL